MFFRKKKDSEASQKSGFDPETIRTILMNAIKMQALYSGGKIRFVDTSSLIH